MRLGLAAVLIAMLCAGCGTHPYSLYPTADLSQPTYSAVRQLRREGQVEVVSLAALTPLRGSSSRASSDPLLGSAATPRIRTITDAAPTEPTLVAAGGPVGEPLAPAGRESDAPERFVCADGSLIDVSYSLDRRTATVQSGDAAPIELARTEDTGLPTYQNGSTTLRRMGPRLGWSVGGDAGGAATITVESGDTLSTIALERFGSLDAVADIVAANAGTISNPDLIFPGQVIALPGGSAAEQSCRRTVDASAPRLSR